MASRPLTPYCVSRLIQSSNGCYHFYIYRKCSKINTFGNGRCTHAWAAIVLFFGIAALSIFGGVKFNDSLFFSKAIVIFCTQRIIAIFSHPYQSEVVETSKIPTTPKITSNPLYDQIRFFLEYNRQYYTGDNTDYIRNC